MHNNEDDDDHHHHQQQSLPRSPITYPHSPQLDPTLYDGNQETHKNEAQPDDVLDLLLNNGGSYGEFSSCEVPKSSGELVGSSGLGELGLGFNNSGFVRGSLGLIDEDNEKCSRYQALKSSEELVRSTVIDELGLGVNDSGFNFDFGSENEFVGGSLRLNGEEIGKCGSYEVSKSSEELVRSSGVDELGKSSINSGFDFDFGSENEIVGRSLRLNGEEIGKCGWYEVSKSSGELVRSSQNDELGLGLNNSGCDFDSVSKTEIVERSLSLNGEDFAERSMNVASKSSGDVFRSSGSDELGLGLINSGCDIDFGSKIEIIGGSSRLIDEDNSKCSMYEVSKSSGELINLSGADKLGGGLNNTAVDFVCGSKAEIVGKSSGLIGEEDDGECSMYGVSKTSEELVKFDILGLGSNNSAVDFEHESKTEIFGISSGSIDEDNGECSMYEVSKSSEEMGRCLEPKELGLGLDNPAVDFGCGSKTEIVGNFSQFIGEDNGQCSMYEVSKSPEKMGKCLESKELALGLDNSAVDFDCGSKTEVVGNSSGLIGEDNGERSMYEVSNSSEKMVRCLESKELGLGLDNPAVDFGCESKTEIVGNFSGLIGEDNGECSMYEVSKSSEKIDRCLESKELGLGLDNSDVVYDGGCQSESPKNKVLLSDERTVRRSPRTSGSSNGVKPSQCSQNKVSNTSGKLNNKSPKDKVLLLSDERRRSPRLIGSSNDVNTVECSSYKVSNSSGKLVPSSKSMKLGLESNNSGVNSVGLSKNKTPKNKVVLLTCDKTTRKSPRLMDSAKMECIGLECSMYTSSSPLGKMDSCLGSKELGLGSKPSFIVNGKRELDSLLSSGDKLKVQVSNKKMKKSDCGILDGERHSSRISGLKRESVNEVELNLGEKASLQLIKLEKSNRSKGKSGTKCLDSNLLVVESLEDKVLRRSPRGLPSTFAMDDDDAWDEIELGYPKKQKKKKIVTKKEEPKVRVEKSNVGGKKNCFFIGEPIPEEEALQKWGWRYQLMKSRRSNSRSLTGNVNEDDEPILDVKCHYAQAQIKGCIFHLGDCASIRGDNQKHVGRIVEFFQTTDSEDYFRVQWFYKPEDTVMKEASSFHDKKRLFYSGIMNDNLLACIISKVNVIQVAPQVNFHSSSEMPSDFYYNMEYCLEYSTFRNLPTDNPWESSNLPSLGCPESTLSLTSSHVAENSSNCETCNAELTMLDLYAGCGGMSTGLCVGAKISGVNLVTRWAIDADSSACESLRLNHSNVDVKNETAEDFLELLKQWEKLCKKFVSKETQNEGTQEPFASQQEVSKLAEACSDAQSDSDIAADELEVASLVDICYGDTNGSGESGLKFKVRWKGYDPSEDTWEPVEGLSNCPELIQEFVINGFKNKILPLPGSVDVICGGPPCQGISGYNRFRSVEAPLDDERNQQLVVFMDVVEYLRPKFVLMENVMDIIRFDKGSLGRYAMSRLVHMNYQARVGIMAAGCYGLPQYRLRTFFWGALPSEQLPQFPLPTHDVVARYWPPAEFERNVVAYVENSQPADLEDAVFLGDAISDLPAVTNYEGLDEMPYTKPPETEFQKYIRSTKNVEAVLYDHRPHQLFEDDYLRVCQIPRRKGANFRDLPGVIVGDDNVVRRDPTIETMFLPSGMPLVPEYAFTFEQGKSKRPFARLWWGENVATIVTYPNCHSSAVLHPEQDRVLTVRECARLQGFPDDYRFSGTVKQRYRQVGNAVAIPVAKALGYALGMASQKLTSKEPLLTLPPKFAYSDHL